MAGAGKQLQIDSPYCFISINGVVSGEYLLKELPDPKLRVLLESSEGQRQRVHQERLVPVDCCGKAIVVNKVLKTVCPRCRHLVDITPDKHVGCDCLKQKIPVLAAEGTRLSFSNEKDDIMPTQAATDKVDLAYIASYGSELWKRDLNFDHAHIETVGYALLNDSPARKLCFQTYRGSLGKKADGLARLCLPEFKANTPNGQGKTVGYAIKGSLDDERARLTKDGYTKVEDFKNEEEDVSPVTEEE